MLRRIAFAIALVLSGALAAHAQTYPDPLTNLKAPLGGTRIYGKFGRNSLDVWDDGSIGIHDLTPTPFTAVASSCGSVGAQLVLNVSPPGGQYVYVTSAYFSSVQNGSTSAGTNLSFTETNLGFGTWGFSTPGTANTMVQIGPLTFKPPIKSIKPGIATGFTSPGATTDQAFCITYTYYFGS